MALARRSILQNVKTTLEGILASAGYNLTVARVERVFRAPDDPKAHVLPWAGYMAGRTVHGYEPANQIRCELFVHLFFLGAAKDDDEAEAFCSKAQDDTIVAFAKDRTRGGFASSTSIEEDESSEGLVYDHASERAQWTCTLRVVYYRTANAST